MIPLSYDISTPNALGSGQPLGNGNRLELGEGRFFCFPSSLSVTRKDKSLDKIKSEMCDLVLAFIHQIRSSRTLRICGSAGLFFQLITNGVAESEIENIEHEINTPIYAKTSYQLYQISDLNFQTAQDSELIIDEIKQILSFYLSKVAENDDYSFEIFSKSLRVKKEYVEARLHNTGQTTVMLPTRVLEVRLRNTVSWRIDITEGYSLDSLPQCDEKTVNITTGEGCTIQVCSLEQLANDLLYAFHNTVRIIKTTDNKYFYRLRLLKKLIENPALASQLSEEIKSDITRFYQNNCFKGIRLENRTVKTGAVTANSGNTVESQKWPLNVSSDTALLPHKPAKKESSTISGNSTVKTSCVTQTISDNKICMKCLAQSKRFFFPMQTEAKKSSVSTQTKTEHVPGSKEMVVSELSKVKQIVAQSGTWSISNGSNESKKTNQFIDKVRNKIYRAYSNMSPLKSEVSISFNKEEFHLFRSVWDFLHESHTPIIFLSEHFSWGKDFVYSWVLEDISNCRLRSQNNLLRELQSPIFHVNDKAGNSYRMRFHIYLDGYTAGAGKETHVSLFVRLITGVADSRATWPLNKKLTFILRDQSATDNPKHIYDTILPGNAFSSSMRPVSIIENIIIGLPTFAEQSSVFNSERYLSNDTLSLQLGVSDNDNPDYC